MGVRVHGVARLIAAGSAAVLVAGLTSIASVLVAGPAAASPSAAYTPGTVFIADTNNGRVVQLLPGGSQRTVASDLSAPMGLAVDLAGNLYIAEFGNGEVVKLPADGSPRTTVATGLGQPAGIALDTAGNLYVADFTDSRVVKVPLDGSPQSDVGTGLMAPFGVAVDSTGNVYIADSYHNRVVKVPADGSPQSDVGTGLALPQAVAVAANGDLYIADAGHARVVKVPADNSPQSDVGTEFGSLSAVAVDGAGNVYTTDNNGNRATEVPADGTPRIDVGTALNNPDGIAVAPSRYAPGTVFLANAYDDTVVQLAADGTVQGTVGSGLNRPFGVAVDAFGNVYIADTDNNRVVEVPADGSPQTTVGSGLSHPYGLAVDAAGNVYIADTDNNRVVEVPADGSPQTTVDTGVSGTGVAVDAAGNVYIADGNNGRVVKVPADGSPQTPVDTGLTDPYGVAVDAAGNVYITDLDTNHTVEVPADGTPQHAVGTASFQSWAVAVFGAAAAPQAITYTSTAPTDAVVGGSYSVAATGGASGQDARFSVDGATTNAACTVTGTTVQFAHAGSCVLDADQYGAAYFKPAPTAPQSFTVGQSPTTVTVSAPASVFGAPVQAAATVFTATGSAAGSVQFSVDGTDFGAPVTVSATASGATVHSADLTDSVGDPLTVGSHPLGAAFTPNDASTYSSSSGTGAQVTNQAASRSTFTATATTLSMSVAALAPATGTPTGTVTFTVAGVPVGTAPVVDGVATLAYATTAEQRHQVGAAYSGDTQFAASSASSAPADPAITATIASAHAKTHFGWYRSSVTVTFHCATNGAALTQPCPAPVTLVKSGAARSVTRTITAMDGGTATVAVRGINIDTARPTVHVTGVRNGAGYGATAPTAGCAGHDALSGLARCTLTKRTDSSGLTRYTVQAVDKAGNVASASGSYRTLTTYLQGASYSGGTFTIHTGRTYTLITHGATRPTYYDAAIYPGTPTHRDLAFYAAGHHRWALGVTMTASLHSHRYWNLGIKYRTMHTIKIRVS
jgi:sugar lactone lactonase YvrE